MRSPCSGVGQREDAIRMGMEDESVRQAGVQQCFDRWPRTAADHMSGHRLRKLLVAHLVCVYQALHCVQAHRGEVVRLDLSEIRTAAFDIEKIFAACADLD
jgi:hypothetical protein